MLQWRLRVSLQIWLMAIPVVFQSRTRFAVLYFYEFIITFDTEVILFWHGRRLTGAVVLFAMNRYLTLVVLMFQIMSSFVPFTTKVRFIYP